MGLFGGIGISVIGCGVVDLLDDYSDEKEEFIMLKVLLHTLLVFATGGIWGVVLIVRYLLK